jgi:hypothetical protein
MNSEKNAAVSGGSFDRTETFGDLLPQQYYDILSGPRRSDGARDLMLAVLEDAIRTYVTNVATKTTRQRRLFEEVKAWFDTRGDRAPFSFETICETFDIDANSLRQRLGHLSAENFGGRMRAQKRSRLVNAA